MRSWIAEDIIRVWEAGYRQGPAERAVTMLSLANPEESAAALRRLSLGRRNARLFGLRERLFGVEMNAFAECPQCRERLEFRLDGARLRSAGPAKEVDLEFDLDVDGYTVRFRLLDTDDLHAAASAADVESARKVLVQRCVIDARRQDCPVPSVDLPEAVVEQLATRLAECDPQAETLIALVCPACAFQWQLPLDIASFCYSEISALAARLLREVHTLARAYCWREADILAMSARRRQYYLEMLDQ